MTVQISSPSLWIVPSYRQAIANGFDGGSRVDATVDDIQFLKAYLNPPLTVTLPSGKVVERMPETHFWLAYHTQFIGRISIRHRLTPSLEQKGGHIGYAVYEPYRNRGYAKLLLRHALVYAGTDLHLPKVLITIDDDNPASWKVVEACGGKLYGTDKPDQGRPDKLCRYYWVDLT